MFWNIRLKNDATWTIVYQEDAGLWVKQQRKEESARLNRRLSVMPVESVESAGSSAGPHPLLAPQPTGRTKATTWNGRAATGTMETG